MNIDEIAKQQFSERMSGELLHIEVEKWKDETGQPVKIYFKPSMTFKQQQKILKFANEQDQAKTVIMTFITRSLDAEGKRIFSDACLTDILNTYDPEIVSDIVLQMRALSQDEEDIKKN